MSLSSALSTSFGLAPGDSAHEIEIAAQHGVQPAAAPPAGDVANHRGGAVAIAANDDWSARRRSEQPGGRGKFAALRRILLRPPVSILRCWDARNNSNPATSISSLASATAAL